MSKDIELKRKWEEVCKIMRERIGEGSEVDLDTMLFMIGIQEYGQVREYNKEDKVNLLHVAVCRLLEPYGYYKFSHKDADGWPHYEKLGDLPPLRPGEQSVLMKEAIVGYFEEMGMV